MVAQLPGAEFAGMDLCTNPGAICEDNELKWMAAMYYWATSVQTDECFNPTLNAFVSGFDSSATTAGCISFPRGCGGNVNNGAWSQPAHAESGRLTFFNELVAAVRPYLQDPLPDGATDGDNDSGSEGESTTVAATTARATAATTVASTAVPIDPLSSDAGFRLVGEIPTDTAADALTAIVTTLHPRYDDVIFSSGAFGSDGSVEFGGGPNLAHMNALRSSARVFVSVGGGTVGFPCNKDAAAYIALADQIGDYCMQHGFSGINLDVQTFAGCAAANSCLPSDLAQCGTDMATFVGALRDAPRSLQVLVSTTETTLNPSTSTISRTENQLAPFLSVLGNDASIAVHTPTFGAGSKGGVVTAERVKSRALLLANSFRVGTSSGGRRERSVNAWACPHASRDCHLDVAHAQPLAAPLTAAPILYKCVSGECTPSETGIELAVCTQMCITPTPLPPPTPPAPPSGPVGHRIVIYLDWKIDWNDLGGDIKAAINQGATHVVLGFWMHGRSGVDAAQTWAAMSEADKAETMAYAKSKNAFVMVSAGGATENVEDFVKANTPTGAEYGKAAAEFAAAQMLDGVDFDLELAPGNSAPFKDGSFISWAVAASKAAKSVFARAGKTSVISHAPQAPYFSPVWAGKQAGYVEIWKQSEGSIDFFFVQYYNQGDGVYATFSEVFIESGGGFAPSTAVSELVAAGIPSTAIVVGKPVLMSGMANNGMVPAATLAAWISTARRSVDANFAGGVGGWMYATGDKDVCHWLNVLAPTVGRKPTDVCSPATSSATVRTRRAGAIGSCEAWSDDNVACETVTTCWGNSVGPCIATHNNVCYPLDDNFPDSCPTSTEPCCKETSSGNDAGATTASPIKTEWTTADLAAATKLGDSTKCYYAIFDGDKCDSNGGVFLIDSDWYANHAGGPYNNKQAPKGCGTVVENWFSRDESHKTYQSNLIDGTDVANKMTYVAAFNGECPTDAPSTDAPSTDAPVTAVPAVTTKSSPGDNGSSDIGGKKVIGYFTNWAQYRNGKAKFMPESIDATLLTHVCYAFAMINDRNQVVPFEWNDVVDWNPQQGLYARFHTHVRSQNPAIQTLISLGGWTFNEKPETKLLFSKMAATKVTRAQFIASCIAFARLHTFDGVDIDWEYPGHAGQGGAPDDKPSFTLLLQEFRAAINAEGASSGKPTLLLTIAVGAGSSTVDNGYEVEKIHSSLDWIGVMSYDLHGSWESSTGQHAGLYAEDSTDQLSVSGGMEVWQERGAPANKLIMGIGTYGRGWTLASAANAGVGAPAKGASTAGPFTAAAGFLAYYEVEDWLHTGGTATFDSVRNAMYAVKGTDWVGYDNAATTRTKCEFALAGNYAGAMVWALDLDRFWADGNDPAYPILRSIHDTFSGASPAATTVATTTEAPVNGGDDNPPQATTAASAASTTASGGSSGAVAPMNVYVSFTRQMPGFSTTLGPAAPQLRQLLLELNDELVTIGGIVLSPVGNVRCAFSNRILHSRMPLHPTHVRLKRTCA
jgi:chitinase